jgi:transcriptional repressor NrdR
VQCPNCKELNRDRVIDSRSTEGGAVIRRRRECQSCKRRFTTKERVEKDHRITVVKRDQSRVAYDREKVIAGIRHACYKLPITDDQIESLIDGVAEDIFQFHERDVTTAQIGQFVIERLRELNAVAYVRFMSVYQSYKDVAEFIEEIRNVRDISATQMPDQASLFDDPASD